MAPSVTTFAKVNVAPGNNMKERFRFQAKTTIRGGRDPFLSDFSKCRIDVSDCKVESILQQIRLGRRPDRAKFWLRILIRQQKERILKD